MAVLSLKVPTLGESVTEATIGKWRKAEGDRVTADEPLVEVESEKATMEVVSPGNGVLKRLVRAAGDTVKVGEVIAEIEEGAAPAEAPAPAPAAPAEPANAPAAAARSKTPAPPAPAAPNLPTVAPGAAPTASAPMAGLAGVNGSGPAAGEVKASPALRRMMAENALSPADVHGTGPAGRIQREDVMRAATPTPPPAVTAPTPARAPTVSRPEHERVVAMTPLRRTVARRLLEAQNTAAILTTFNEVNMANVMSLRERYQDAFQKRHGIKLGFMSFFVKAAVDALKAFPIVNAEVRGTDIVYKSHYDIGVAVGGGKGLVVPVVRDADTLSLAEVERAIADLATRARDNKLSMQDLEGGTFTISNGGIYGSMLSTPILNPPQSGILGLHNIQKRPMAVGDAVVVQPMMYLALSYDHRIIDGREAVQFLVRIKECIEDPQRILIEV